MCTILLLVVVLQKVTASHYEIERILARFTRSHSRTRARLVPFAQKQIVNGILPSSNISMLTRKLQKLDCMVLSTEEVMPLIELYTDCAKFRNTASLGKSLTFGLT